MQQPAIEIHIDGIAQGGDGVGRRDGQVVFVSGALPGELVRARLAPAAGAWARATALTVLRAAPERVPSFCPLETSCSAAAWRWVDQAAQRRYKAAILEDQLRHLGGIDVAVAAPPPGPSPELPASTLGKLPASPKVEAGSSSKVEGTTSLPDRPELGFRTAADLHVDGAAIGYYLPGTRRVADVPACCLHHPLLNTALATLRPLLQSFERPTLRHVGLRCSPETGQALAVLDGRGALRELARRWHTACPTLAGVVDSRGRPLAGAASIERRAGGLRFRVSGSSFWQTNALRVDALAARVGELLEPRPDERLLDLYCGAGLFSLSLAGSTAQVLGVEEWAPAVRDAEANAKLNAITNARFVAGAVERVLPGLEGGWQLAVLDPPRRGCAPEALAALAALRPRRIVYVSCHPGTLARDCKLLAASGYTVEQAETIDMFPHTHHIEAIVVLNDER